jgi:hypothetical protein
VLCFLLVVLLTVFAAAFVGGFFVGKDKGKSESKEAVTASPSYQHRAYSIYYDGKSQVIPAFRGKLPVQDFIQPRAVLMNNQLVTVPGNPLLTPKGTSQIFIYQHEDEVSLIVTATGQNYGEKVANASLSGEGSYTITTKGLEGDLVQLTDGYHQMYDRVPIPDTLSIELQWGNVGSRGFVVVLSDPSSVSASLDFTSLFNANQPLNIRGCYEYDTEIPQLPNPTSPLRITPHTGKFSLHNKPEPESETTIPGPADSNLQLVRLNSNSRRRRAMTTRNSPGVGFILFHPGTKEVRHRIEIRREERHGGKNGSLCWNVQNHVDSVEASFCSFFYRALYNGLSNEPSDDGKHSMMISTHFRRTSDSSDSTTPWHHIVSLAHDIDAKDIIQGLKNRHRRSWFSGFGNDVSQGFSDLSDDVSDGWNSVSSGVQNAYDDVSDAVSSAASSAYNWYDMQVHTCCSALTLVVCSMDAVCMMFLLQG